MLIGLDLGTTGLKAAAYEPDSGRCLAEAACRLCIEAERQLGLHRYIVEGRINAFDLNFDALREGEGPVNTVRKAMTRGVGFAGAGAVLTTSLVAAPSVGYGLTSFAGMFCPDWADGSVVISHMGGFTLEFAVAKPQLYEKEYGLPPARKPAALESHRTCRSVEVP